MRYSMLLAAASLAALAACSPKEVEVTHNDLQDGRQARAAAGDQQAGLPRTARAN